MSDLPSFETLARRADAQLDELALAVAAEFRPVEAGAALAALDTLGGELRVMIAEADGTRAADARACVELLGERHGFAGDREEYDHPDNSMLDRVLARRRGLPIVLSVVYVAVAERAGVRLGGVGLPGHFVVGHFGAQPAVLLDPFAGGAPIDGTAEPHLVRPWTAAEIAMRMLNNLVGSYQRRGDLGRAITAARLRLELPAVGAVHERLEGELRRLQARLN